MSDTIAYRNEAHIDGLHLFSASLRQTTDDIMGIFVD